MTAERADDGVNSESLLRFDLAVQRNHLLVYSMGFVTALIGKAVNVFPLRYAAAFLMLATSFSLAISLLFLLKRGVSRAIINPTWMIANIAFATLGVYATGGITSPWFIWYVANSAAAAFASGKRAAYLVTLGSTAAYLSLMLWMGHATLFNYPFALAFVRMLFLFGASYYFVIGVANLQEKRLTVRRLEAAEKKRVAELTRITADLKARTDDLAEANRRIREADRLKSQFLANMSHELRTPMNSIIGFSEILVERLEGKVDPKHQEFLRHILTSGQHLLAIINDVLDLSKIEAGKMEVFAETFDVKPVIDSVCSLMRGMTKPSPQFIIEIPPDLPRIETDLAKFKQVLFNLLSNAVKFSPAGAPVRVVVSKHGDGGPRMIMVAVHDEGIGIDADNHEMIFQEFRQVDASVRREFGGTGLGLALVRKFVELQGGVTGVESEIGKGSTFWFTLPMESQVAVVDRPADLPIPEPSVDRVLVVEDDANAYELISSALSSAGFVPVRARHGEEALRLARDIAPVAITLDLVLPGLDGWEVLKRLKSEPGLCDIPVVIISVVHNRELGVALGAVDYFIKPVERERFLSRIREIATIANSHKPRLLLIDDDAAVHTLLREELERIGYAVVHAYSGEEGLVAASSTSPDLIILDLMMPGMSGFEVAGALKQNPATAGMPIVVLTSKEITNEDRAQLQAKVSTFVQKGSSSRERLVSEIRRLRAKPPVPPPA